jgi:4-amino-4-deoxy-L-arabinose transferase-like glycosyltransferase
MKAASHFRTDKVERLALLAILLVALVARFRYLPHIEHNIDHAYPIWQALQTIDRGEYPLAGQGTSVLFANPALTGYLFAPVVALTRSPLAVYVFVIALNWLGVWLAYRAGRGMLGTRVGLVVAGLMAVNPWVIEYSRTSWVQSLLPFFACAVAWLLWPVLLGESRRPARRIALALALTALFIQTYLLAYFILIPVGLLLIVFWRRLPRRGLAAGLAVIALTTALYSLGLLAQWETVNQRLRDFGSGEARLSAEAWNAGVRLVTGAEYELARGIEAPAADSQQRHQWSRAAHVVLLAALIAGMGRAGLGLWRGGRMRQAAVITLAWFGLPIIAMSYTGNPVHSFYLLLSLPAGYVLAAWGLDLVFRVESNRRALALVAIGVPFAALMLTNSARYYQETAATPGAHGLTALPVGHGIELGRAIATHLPPGGIVYAGVEGWIVNSFAGQLFPVVSDARAPGFHYVPVRGGVYVSSGYGEPPQPLAGERAAVFTLADGYTLAVDVLPPAAELPLPETVLEIPSQQGITFLAYELDTAGEDWTLTTIWRVDAVAPEVHERIFVPFLHVFDDGRPVLNIGGEGLPGHAWHVGEMHVHRLTFTPPAEASGPLTFYMGQVDGLHNDNVIFLPAEEPPDVVIRLPERVWPE